MARRMVRVGARPRGDADAQRPAGLCDAADGGRGGLRRFYEDKLGFRPSRETAGGIYYGAGHGSLFTITRSSGRPSGSHTQMAFQVDDIRREVDRAPATAA